MSIENHHRDTVSSETEWYWKRGGDHQTVTPVKCIPVCVCECVTAKPSEKKEFLCVEEKKKLRCISLFKKKKLNQRRATSVRKKSEDFKILGTSDGMLVYGRGVAFFPAFKAKKKKKNVVKK